MRHKLCRSSILTARTSAIKASSVRSLMVGCAVVVLVLAREDVLGQAPSCGEGMLDVALILIS